MYTLYNHKLMLYYLNNYSYTSSHTEFSSNMIIPTSSSLSESARRDSPSTSLWNWFQVISLQSFFSMTFRYCVSLLLYVLSLWFLLVKFPRILFNIFLMTESLYTFWIFFIVYNNLVFLESVNQPFIKGKIIYYSTVTHGI